MNPAKILAVTFDELPALVRIERASFPVEMAWSQKKFEAFRRQRETTIVAAHGAGDRVTGFLVFRREEDGYTILNLAVEPERRREGIGSALVFGLMNTARIAPRERLIKVGVEERNLPVQLFFRACGFRAMRINPEVDRSWIDFEYLSAGADGFGDEGTAVLAAILHGDGRTLRV